MIKNYIRAIWAENVKEWRIELTYPVEFFRTLVEPTLYILPFVLFGIAVSGGVHSSSLEKLAGTGDVVTFTVLGYVVMGFLGTSLWAMGLTLRKEQFWGTLEFIFATPMPRWVYVMGQAVHSVVHQGLIILIQLLLFALVFGLGIDPKGILPACISAAMMLVALFGLGMLVSSFTLIAKEAWVVSEALHSLILAVTPVAFPLVLLPQALRAVSYTMPTTHGLTLVRHYLMGEKIPGGTAMSFVWLILLGVSWVVIGFLIFNATDRKVRAKGMLAEY